MNEVERALLILVAEMGLTTEADLEYAHQMMKQHGQTVPSRYRVLTANGGHHVDFFVTGPANKTVKLKRSLNLKWETWEYRPEIRERIRARILWIIKTNLAAGDDLTEPNFSKNGEKYVPFEFGERVIRRRIHDVGPTPDDAVLAGVKHVSELNAPTHIGMVIKCERIPDDPYRGFNVTIAPDSLVGHPKNHVTFRDYELDRLALSDDVYEIERIYDQWFGKCYTCRHWGGKREYPTEAGLCEKVESENYKEVTTTDGYCKKWDAFEDKIVFEMMEKWAKEGGA